FVFWHKMDLGGEELKKSGSRFQVARVNTINKDDQSDPDQDSEELQEVFTEKVKSDIQPDNKICSGKQSTDLRKLDTNIANANINPSGGRESVGNGPESPCATFSISGDSLRSRGSDGYNKTNGAMNTIEALPCVDHYRNIFSATGGGLRTRPTLAELHEELDDEDHRGNKKDAGSGYEGTKTDSPLAGDKVQIAAPVRFGWIQGVLLELSGASCFLKITRGHHW
ncbi:unnamed protein product, partial [Candidula unifasciata]